MMVRDLMQADVQVILDDQAIAEAIVTLEQGTHTWSLGGGQAKHVGLPNGELVGVISQNDIVRAIARAKI